MRQLNQPWPLELLFSRTLLRPQKLEEEVENLTLTLHGRLSDGAAARNRAASIETKAALYEAKLAEELADRGVYSHMIQRLSRKALDAKKETLARESQLRTLQLELGSALAALLAARQEKSAAELQYKQAYTAWWERKQQNVRALDDLTQAVAQTKLQLDTLEQREVSRKQHVAAALGELKMRASRKLRHESSAQMTHFSEIQEELSDTDWKLLEVEAELKKIVEAAGTSDVDKIIAKFVGRDDVMRALKDEHTVADARMRKLREKRKQLEEALGALRGAAVNSRTIYQEMDQTSERLKDIEKEAAMLADHFNRSSVMMDAFRACLLKCLAKLGSVKGSLDYDDHHELSRALEAPSSDLLHMVEQKLNRVLDVINREKAERELHRSEANANNIENDKTGTSGGNGGTHAGHGANGANARAPAPAESEEHFILRMSTPDTSASNVRVRPKSRVAAARPPVAPHVAHVGHQPSNGHLMRRTIAGGNDLSALGVAGASGGELTNGEDSEANAGAGAVGGGAAGGATGNAMNAEAGEELLVIDRHMRKKLMGLVVNRSKRGKKAATPNASG